MSEKIIALVDMDCFYVQVEERDNPHIKGKPAAVVQYNSWKGGGIIAVNYEARAVGIKRGMRGEEAKAKCEDLILVKVPMLRGKADLTKYRNAGKEVLTVLCDGFSATVERASVDEAYIDLTEAILAKEETICESLIEENRLFSTWVVGYDNADLADANTDKSFREDGLKQWLKESYDNKEMDPDAHQNTLKLYEAAVVCEKMRKKVLEVTGFKCSAGISHSKMLSKLACGLHKPNQQSILPTESITLLWEETAIGKVRNLGGKLGETLTSDFGCKTMKDFANISLERLRSKYDEKTASWLHLIGQGIDNEVVTSRQLLKSIGCGKNFNGKEVLDSKEKALKWINVLSEELAERLKEDNVMHGRIAKTLTVHVRSDDALAGLVSFSRSAPVPAYAAAPIALTALDLISPNNTTAPDNKWHLVIRNLSMTASKFEDVSKTTKINEIFQKINSGSLNDKSSIKIDKIQNSDKSQKHIFDLQKIKEKSKTNLLDNETEQKKSFFLQFLSKKNEGQQKKHHYNTTKDNAVSSSLFAGAESNCLDGDDSDGASAYYLSTDCEEAQSSGDDQQLRFASPDRRSRNSERKNYKRNSSESSFDQKANKKVSQDNSIVSIEQEKREDSNNSTNVSISELFPDLSNVDDEIVAMLPFDMRIRVQEAINANEGKSDAVGGSNKSTSSVTKDVNSVRLLERNKSERCFECGLYIEAARTSEHRDFHVATRLRCDQLEEARKQKVSFKSNKNNACNTRGRGKETQTQSIPKIDSFFKKL